MSELAGTSTIGMRRMLGVSGLLAALAVIATLSGNGYLSVVIGIPAYLVLPGVLMQVAFRRELVVELNSLLYAVGLSLLFWMGGGLAINTALPVAGFDRPLRLVFILPVYGLGIFVFAGVAYRKRFRQQLSLGPLVSSMQTGTAAAIALLLPVLSVLGSTTLNNSGPGYIIIGMLTLLGAFIVYLTIVARGMQSGVYPVIVFCIALSLLLMYSMRSWYVIGWDIQDELRVFQTTLTHSYWRIASYPNNAYNASLSITILPTILTQLLRLSPEYLLKFGYQVIFAVVPVAVYSTARRLMLPILALLSAILFTVQTWFFEQMPALARQEIGILMFVLLVLALFDRTLNKRTRYMLSYLFSIGLVVSHYSTAYIWLGIAMGTFVLFWVLHVTSHSARRSPRLLPWHIIAATVVLTALWDGPITHTANHAITVASTSTGQLGQILAPRVISDGVIRAFLAPPLSNTDEAVQRVAKRAVDMRPGKTSDYFAPSELGSFTPRAVDDLQYAHNYLPPAASHFLVLTITLLKAIVTNVLSLVGVLLLWRLFVRGDTNITPEFVVMCGVSYLAIGFVLFLPYLQENYNLSRLYLQLFSLLAIPALAAFWVIVRRNVTLGLPLIGVSVALILVLLSGVLGQFTGGAQRIELAQSKGAFETLYVYTDEVYAARWLSSNRDKTVPVYADTVANLRLESYADLDASATNIFPGAIARTGYVYFIEANAKRGHGFAQLDNKTYSYNYPRAFLDSNKDLIYSSGSSGVYR